MFSYSKKAYKRQTTFIDRRKLTLIQLNLIEWIAVTFFRKLKISILH